MKYEMLSRDNIHITKYEMLSRDLLSRKICPGFDFSGAINQCVCTNVYSLVIVSSRAALQCLHVMVVQPYICSGCAHGCATQQWQCSRLCRPTAEQPCSGRTALQWPYSPAVAVSQPYRPTAAVYQPCSPKVAVLMAVQPLSGCAHGCCCCNQGGCNHCPALAPPRPQVGATMRSLPMPPALTPGATSAHSRCHQLSLPVQMLMTNLINCRLRSIIMRCKSGLCCAQ